MKNATDKRKISEMRNLGPACEKDFSAIGITTAAQLIELGPENAFVKMLLGRLEQRRSAMCCNAAYLYHAGYRWNHVSVGFDDWRSNILLRNAGRANAPAGTPKPNSSSGE